jgi:hypothetical protein
MGTLKKAGTGGDAADDAAKALALYAGQAAPLVKHSRAAQLMEALVKEMGW